MKVLKKVYEEKYKALMIIPLALVILALLQIGMQYASTGDFLNKGVSLKGGITLIIPDKTADVSELDESLIEMYPQGDFNAKLLGGGKGIVLESSGVEREQLITAAQELVGDLGEYSVQEIGSSLGESFFKETISAMIIAFICMGIVVLITFRKLIPSMAVVAAAVMDILCTLAVFNLFGFKMSSAGIAGMLMLIGYSVDTDMLLSTKVLRKRQGSIMDGVYTAMKTGLTMSGTTITAIIIGLLFAQSEVIQEIMTILLIGLVFDIIATYIMNVGLLRWYLEK